MATPSLLVIAPPTFNGVIPKSPNGQTYTATRGQTIPVLTGDKQFMLNLGFALVEGYDGAESQGITISDGTNIETGITDITFTSGGAVVSSGGPGTADVLISGGYSVPLASSFTFINQKGATLTDNANGPLVWLNLTNVSDDEISLAHFPAPAGSWIYTVKSNWLCSNLPTAAGITIDDGTKIISYTINQGSVSPQAALQVDLWNPFGTHSSTLASYNGVSLPNPVWQRIIYNSVTPSLTFQYSIDGFTWITLFTQTGTISLVPANVGIGADLNHNDPRSPTVISIITMKVA